jgi:hypothetical protein
VGKCFDFEWAGTPPHPADHIARLAIVWPLVLTRGQKPDWPKALTALVRLWRRQVVQLWRLGCAKALTSTRLSNCRPSMFFLKGLPKVVYTCKLENVCPWCYARSLLGLIERVTEGYAAGETLFLATHKEAFSAAAHPHLDLKDQLTQRAERLRGLLSRNRPACSGAFWMLTCEPAERGGAHHWLFHSRLLALVRPGRHFDVMYKDWKTSSTAAPGSSDFQGYLGAALRYPTGLLRGPADLVLPILEAREGLRLRGSYGKLRKPDKRKGG